METGKLTTLVIAQLAAGVWAAIVFRLGLDPRLAGIFAGTSFIAVGLFGCWTGYRWEGFARFARTSRFFVFGLSAIHLVIFALPMLGYRLAHWSDSFSKIEFWGLSGPEFHSVSTQFYSFWFLVVFSLALAERVLFKLRRPLDDHKQRP